MSQGTARSTPSAGGLTVRVRSLGSQPRPLLTQEDVVLGFIVDELSLEHFQVSVDESSDFLERHILASELIELGEDVVLPEIDDIPLQLFLHLPLLHLSLFLLDLREHPSLVLAHLFQVKAPMNGSQSATPLPFFILLRHTLVEQRRRDVI